MNAKQIDVMVRVLGTIDGRRGALRVALGLGLVRVMGWRGASGATTGAAGEDGGVGVAVCHRLGKTCDKQRGDRCCGGAECKGGRCRCRGPQRGCLWAGIPATDCCDSADCGGGATCQDGHCLCPSGKKDCNGRCLPAGDCCTNGEWGPCESCQRGACFSGCQPVQECRNGRCTCTQASCAGCCDGTACRRGDTDAQCGTGGAACAACTAPDTCGGGARPAPAAARRPAPAKPAATPTAGAAPARRGAAPAARAARTARARRSGNHTIAFVATARTRLPAVRSNAMPPGSLRSVRNCVQIEAVFRVLPIVVSTSASPNRRCPGMCHGRRRHAWAPRSTTDPRGRTGSTPGSAPGHRRSGRPAQRAARTRSAPGLDARRGRPTSRGVPLLLVASTSSRQRRRRAPRRFRAGSPVSDGLRFAYGNGEHDDRGRRRSTGRRRGEEEAACQEARRWGRQGRWRRPDRRDERRRAAERQPAERRGWASRHLWRRRGQEEAMPAGGRAAGRLRLRRRRPVQLRALPQRPVRDAGRRRADRSDRADRTDRVGRAARPRRRRRPQGPQGPAGDAGPTGGAGDAGPAGPQARRGRDRLARKARRAHRGRSVRHG